MFGRGFDGDAKLEFLAAAGLFADDVDGAWSQEDDVQPLGGPDATQGCEL